MQPPFDVPLHLVSRSTVRVRFCETDLMGVVHHANYLTYMEAGRVDWLHRRGVSYEAWMRSGVHLPVVEVRLRYRKAARFDDVLTIETASEPGVLGKIAERLAEAEVNIEYTYLAAGRGGERGLIILRPSDVEKARRVLEGL